MNSIKNIALAARVDPPNVNRYLAEAGYQTRTEDKNYRWQPTAKGRLHCAKQTSNNVVWLVWDDEVAAQVVEALQAPTRQEFDALLKRIELLEKAANR